MRFTNNGTKRVMSTPINTKIADAFKSECQKINIPMNVVLEIFMDEFVNGKIDIIFKRQKDGEFDGSLEYRL